MECSTTHLGLWGESKKLLKFIAPSFPFHLSSPDLANKACPIALHACGHDAKLRACKIIKVSLSLSLSLPLPLKEE